MSTRSLTRIFEGPEPIGQPLLVIYVHSDGYPSGHGADLFKAFLKGEARVVNGIGGGLGIPHYFNGIGCLAAWLVGKLKGHQIGAVYVFPSTIKEPEAWTYDITVKDGRLYLTVREGVRKTFRGQRVVFDGALADFDPAEAEGAVE